MKWGRKPGEPIYLRWHLLSLALAVVFPLVCLQLYKVYIGPLSFDAQLGVGLFVSLVLGLALHFAFRASAKNQP